ncbi:uncharacterized protein SPAPADRAFT_60051 [Spathaspora passalidarum NRRL Y-27907]|uniref:UBC core domain-containing protein n=1 Tax=Spathaspora passalidarum (strain NRRL Y-27907 / 11-Y1) TaxID=619300 RepID=G3ALT4_SPAPN|nr:uncharacterized protein SPAPADRAFT_60051 [Spathaspora passalidarum NRRL Y-27907]EGW32693.1 hypothetical protein SPAPADRAFT_60051 [Spathaspora passalidarum NRRL Y-27907]
MSRHPFHRRLLKEYQSLSQATLPGIKLVSNDENLTNFIFQIRIANHNLYPDYERYYLSINITQDYPVDCPQVKFIIYESVDDDKEDSDSIEIIEKSKIPIHPHIYSNGHICLNLLGEDWTPACSIESILLSIQSMLNTNDKLERPPDNDSYIKHAPLDPKRSRFVYHDDNV